MHVSPVFRSSTGKYRRHPGPRLDLPCDHGRHQGSRQTAVPDGTGRCRRPAGRRRLHLRRAGARSVRPRHRVAHRSSGERQELSSPVAASRWQSGAPGGRRVGLDFGRRSGGPGQVRRTRRPSGRGRDRPGLVGDADPRVQPATRRRCARIVRPRSVAPGGGRRERLSGRRQKPDGLPAARSAPETPTIALCTPIWLAQRSLRVGVTTLLQITFPELPAALRTVDVDIATVPQFWRVPVTPAGQVPVADRPTDLTRTAEVDPGTKSSDMFRFGPSEQVFRVRVDRVIASSSFTSMQWAIVSVTGGDGVEAASAPPFVSADAATVTDYNPVAASGPTLRAGGDGTVVRPRVMSRRVTSPESYECLCTDLRDRAAVLRRPDKVATVVTQLPGAARRYGACTGGVRRAHTDDSHAHAGLGRQCPARGTYPDKPRILAVPTRQPTGGLGARRVADTRTPESPARALPRHGGPARALSPATKPSAAETSSRRG